MAITTRYWVVSLPSQGSPSSVWSHLQESFSKHSFDTPLYLFNVPNLCVLSLSDDLSKWKSFVKSVPHKIRRQIEGSEKVSGMENGSLTVDGVPIDSCITRFVWDEAKYPTMSPLRVIVNSIHARVAKLEDDLKVRVSKYNNVRSQLNAIKRKQSGRRRVYGKDLPTISFHSWDFPPTILY